MKYTRLEVNKFTFGEKEKILVAFLLVIPMISILIGWSFSKWMLKTNQHSNQVTPAFKISKTIDNKKIYYLQVGVFSNENNAIAMIKSLENVGISSSYYKDKDIFRIITNFSTNVVSLEEQKKILSEKGYNCIIKELNILNKGEYNNYKIDLYRALIVQVEFINNQISSEEYEEYINEFYKKYKEDENAKSFIKDVSAFKKAIEENKNSDALKVLSQNINNLKLN